MQYIFVDYILQSQAVGLKLGMGHCSSHNCG
jgi:hypothetical protein